jgi:hypothetical protein
MVSTNETFEIFLRTIPQRERGLREQKIFQRSHWSKPSTPTFEAFDFFCERSRSDSGDLVSKKYFKGLIGRNNLHLLLAAQAPAFC